MFAYEAGGVKVESNSCFLPDITATDRGFISMYGHYKNGVLYRGGGYSKQPNLYLEIMGFIDRCLNKNSE